jgi:catechol 2,3-dioxygenase-like lactoylglutathione lyase family enzyme
MLPQLFKLMLIVVIVLTVPTGLPAQTRFHHLHLNTTDTAQALKFYTSKFDCEETTFLKEPAVWTQQSWLLFNQVKTAPAWELTSAIWHFGWGAEDMKATYQKQLELGTKFFTPLTDISDILGGTPNSGRFFYAYVETPDHGLVELNTSNNHRFGHLHLFSADPLAAAEWYARYFGLQVRSSSPTIRMYRDHQIGPSASLMIDNVNIIIYPVEYSKKAYADHWKGQTTLVSTRGRVVDHVAFSVGNLEETVDQMQKDGVKIIEPIRRGKLTHAFIEGPDAIVIELVERTPVKEGSGTSTQPS